MEPFNGRVHSASVHNRELSHAEVRQLHEQGPPSPGRVVFPQFEIASNPTISLAEIRNRRFNLVDRPPMPAAILQLLATLTEVGMVPEPIPEPHGPIRRRSRYEVLAA
jgi:hypothetical protein